MNGLLFSDLSAICAEADREKLSPLSRKNFWQTVSYEIKDTKGILLSTKQDSFPAPLTLTPRVSGWQRVYVGVVACINQAGNNVVNLKLKNDFAYTQFKPASDIEGSGIEDFFWKCADMTGETVELAKLPGGDNREDCMLGWLRFEPMTEEEVAAFKADEADKSHKNVYVTNDMHCLAYLYAASSQADWDIAVQPYEQSDAEWLSIENVYINDGQTPLPVDETSFNRPGDKNVQHIFNSGSYSDDMLSALVNHGHALGLKMCVSQRMGEWCLPFPTESVCFDNVFWAVHPDCRCVDRDGQVLPMMSYACPAVRRYMIGHLLHQAKNGFDAVQLMAHRGIPYTLFEEPFCAAFEAKYHADPRTLPWEDERVIELRCEFLTAFVRELRQALDASGFRAVQIHLRGLYTPADNRLLGIDPEGLAASRLIDAFIVHPLLCREMLAGGDVEQDGAPGLIDPVKYARYAAEADCSVIWRREGFANAESVKDFYVKAGEEPVSEPDRIREWTALENKYGLPVYFEIMPRQFSAAEYRRRLMEIYDAGGKHVSFWDTYTRAPVRRTWNLIRRAGHPEDIRAFEPGPDGCSTRCRFLKTGDLFTGRFRPNWGT